MAPKRRSIRAEEADVNYLQSGPLRGNVARTPRGTDEISARKAKLHGLRISIAHLLFPDNFPAPVASTLRGGQPPALVTRLIKTTRGYRAAVRDFYEGCPQSTVYARHAVKTYDTRGSQLRQRIFNAGIIVNDHPINVGFKQGTNRPIFFEVHEIDPDSVREHLQQELKDASKREKTLRIQKQVEGLLAQLESQT